MMAASAILLALLATSPGPSGPSGEMSRADQFKAAMIYNFARFATWAPSRFADASSPVVLCVAPTNRLADALERLEGQPVGDRRLRVHVAQTVEASCHMAVVDVPDATPAKVAAMKTGGVLTVSEAPGFARIGAVGLVSVGRQVRFEVNTVAAREAKVALSSQLLRLALAVR
jgi:hypothetical protein